MKWVFISLLQPVCLWLFSEAEQSSVGQLASFCWRRAMAHQPCCWCRRKGCSRVVALFFFFFIFFSLWSFRRVFWHFPATSCFSKLVCLWNLCCSAQPGSVCYIPARCSIRGCAESETCVLKGFLQWGQSCVSSSPSTSCSFVRRNLESSLPCFFFSLSSEKGFVVLQSVNPHWPIYCQHPGGMNQPGLLREACANKNWHERA